MRKAAGRGSYALGGGVVVAMSLLSGCSGLSTPARVRAGLDECRGAQHAVCAGNYPTRIERYSKGVRCRCASFSSLQ